MPHMHIWGMYARIKLTIPVYVGFGEACKIASNCLNETDSITSMLKQRFYSCLIDELKANGLDAIVHINGDLLIKHGKILNLRFDDIDGETLLLMLDVKNICVSSGSACRSNESEPSPVLLAMNITPESARDSIRISFSRMNTIDEVEAAAKTTADCVKILHQETY